MIPLSISNLTHTLAKLEDDEIAPSLMGVSTLKLLHRALGNNAFYTFVSTARSIMSGEKGLKYVKAFTEQYLTNPKNQKDKYIPIDTYPAKITSFPATIPSYRVSEFRMPTTTINTGIANTQATSPTYLQYYQHGDELKPGFIRSFNSPSLPSHNKWSKFKKLWKDSDDASPDTYFTPYEEGDHNKPGFIGIVDHSIYRSVADNS